MKQVSVYNASRTLSKLLRDLPVEITNHGVPVAWLIEPCEENTETEPKAKINFESGKSQNKTEVFVAAAVEEKKKLPFNGGPCFHKALPGMCHVDWCPNAKK